MWKVYEAEKFHDFRVFCISKQLFYMKIQDGAVQIPHIANRSRWNSFAVFTDQSTPRNFSSKIACAISFGHARLPSNGKSFPVNESLVL